MWTNIDRAGMAFAALLLTGLLTGCGGHQAAGWDPPMPNLPPAPATPPPLDAAALAHPRWEAVLVAGSPVLRVADDAVLELDARLQAAGVGFDRISSLSADPERFGGSRAPRGVRPDQSDDEDRPGGAPRRNAGETLPARPSVVLRELLHLGGRPGAACFAYLSGKADGDKLALLDDSVTPDLVDRALEIGCDNAPTVVIVSGCGTGAFAAGPMARPNRLIMTAAARGRAGFGCGANEGFSTFDECLLGALDGAADWVAAFERTRACVARRERLLEQPPVEPQLYVGAAVARLPAPWAGTAYSPKIQFNRGIGRFTRDGLPYFPTMKARIQPEAEAYARAPGPKAMALTFAGTVAWVSGAAGETPDDVARLALQRCEWRSGGACVLYARNDDLAAAGPAGQPPLHPSMLVRAGPVSPATVPFIRDEQRDRIKAYLQLPGPKALALGPDSEAIGIGTGATAEAARQAALAQCDGAGGACVLYATGDRAELAQR